MNKNYVLYFDGECIFCDTWIRIFYRLDFKQKFIFCALQAQQAKEQLGAKFTEQLSTIVMQDVQKQKIYIKSTAVIRALVIAQPLFFPILVLLLFPVSMRNFFYDLVAKYRYKIFGKKDMCSVDPKLDRKRFIIK